MEKGLTQKRIAEILGCHQSMITRWERGECEPTESVIRTAAVYFDVTADYLIGLEDETGTKIKGSAADFSRRAPTASGIFK